MHIALVVAAVLAAIWVLLSALCERPLGTKRSAWYAACTLFGLLVLLPLVVLIVGPACVFKAWRFPYAKSIKPIPGRDFVDGWALPINLIFGNPEDGVSGVDAYGPDWLGAYNPRGTRWRAFLWNLRNWAAGYNYLTWPWEYDPSLLYVGPLAGLQVKIGWQQRYGRTVMVCSRQ